MSLQMNAISTQNQAFAQHAPPEYDEMWNVNTVLPTEHPWNENTQPPAYNTLCDLPIWTIPLSDPESNRSFGARQWNIDSDVPAHSAMSSPQYQTSIVVISQTSEKSLFKYKYWKSPPAILGVLFLLASFFQVGAGTVLASNNIADISYSLTYGIPFWAPVCYLITGCLSLTVQAKPFVCQIRISLFFNILTTILSTTGLVFNVKDVETLYQMSDFPNPQYQTTDVRIHYVLIGTNVALLCISVCAGIFGSSVLCCSSRKNPQESSVENGFITPTPLSDLPETLLPSPPPYALQGVYIGRTTQ